MLWNSCLVDAFTKLRCVCARTQVRMWQCAPECMCVFACAPLPARASRISLMFSNPTALPSCANLELEYCGNAGLDDHRFQYHRLHWMLCLATCSADAGCQNVSGNVKQVCRNDFARSREIWIREWREDRNQGTRWARREPSRSPARAVAMEKRERPATLRNMMMKSTASLHARTSTAEKR